MSSEKQSNLPRLLLVLPCPLPSATIYIIKPLKELVRQNRLIFNVALEGEVTPARVTASDIVLFCRNIEPEYGWILEQCLEQGIPTVYDLDDNFWEVPPELKYAAHHLAPKRIAQLERYLSKVDRVRVYSRPLVEKAQRYNSRVDYVTPCIDMRLAPPLPALPRDDKVRITYVTGRGASDTLISLYADDLSRLLDAHPDRVEVVWWGEIPERFKKLSSSRMINIIHDYDRFIRTLSTEGFDIGLAPLTATSFNLSKTNTKFRDYGACHIAGIYSDVPVYADVEHEKTGLLVPSQPGAWFDAMEKLVQDVPLRSRIREEAFRFVNQHYSQEQVEHQWLQLIDELRSHNKRTRWTGLDVHDLEAVQKLSDESELLRNGLFEAYTIGQHAEERALQLEEHAGLLQAQIRDLHDLLQQTDMAVQERQAELDRLRPMAVVLAHQLEAQRSRRLTQWIERVFSRTDYSDTIYPSYHPLRDDSLIFAGPLKGFRLRPSASLHSVPYLGYRLNVNRAKLKAISVALLFDLFPKQGSIGVEIVGTGGVLVEVNLPVSEIRAEAPLTFEFNPISGSAAALELRVFGRDLDVPVRIFEWRRAGLLGLGSLTVRPFVELRFQSEGS